MDSVVDTQAVQSFLRLAKGAQSRDDFISRVREFDQKFVDAYPAPIITPLPNIPRSNSQATNIKPQTFQPPKNPFTNSAEQKYKLAYTQRNTTNSYVPQYQPQPQPPLASRNKFNPVQVMPHSRSQTNFYRQEDEMYLDQQSGTYGNQLYNDQMYRQSMMNKQYMQNPPDPRGKNYSQVTQQPYIQNNQFLNSFEADEPQYVKYYKKVIPTNNSKPNFTPSARSNPFKQ